MLRSGFIALSVLMCAAFAWAVRDKRITVVALVWVALTGAVSTTDFFAHFVPPRLLLVLVLVPTLVGVTWLAFKSERLVELPVTMLVGFQSFRIVVELLIHQAVLEGVAPPQMTWWPGLNQDLLTGVTALVLTPFASKAPRWLLLSWNWMGLGLLLWVVVVALLSMPTPLQQIEPDNTWVAHFPFTWLPVTMVSMALLGHLVIFRKLRRAAAKSQG